MSRAKQKIGNSYKKYGDFSTDGTEFIVKNPNTPRPWINYLSNGKYCLLISQTGAGYSFYLDPSHYRISRWQPENYLKDVPGRTLYLRDESTGRFWSSGFRPVGKSQGCECRHGLGYTTIKNIYNDVQTEVTFFVPQNESAEIWIAKVTNLSGTKKKLKVFPFIEWQLGDWPSELTVRNIHILVNEGRFDKKRQLIVARQFPWGGKEVPYITFLGSSLKVDGFDTDYENFIGRYRSYANPVVLQKGRCTQSQSRGMNMVGVFEHSMNLAPRQEKEFVVVAGLMPSKENPKAIESAIGNAGRLAAKYRDIKSAKKSLEETRQYWKRAILSKNIIIETPDEELNCSVNIWMKYQIYMNNHWGRSATFYHEGFGEFGYRNTAQDAWSMVSLNPEYAKERLIMLCKHQKKSGQPMPGWSLVAGASQHRPPSDFPIWLPMLLMALVKETGDFGILKEKVKYFDGGIDSIYNHARKATRFLQDVAKSKRGIPLMGTQDWNDAFDKTGIRGKGESVWLGMGLCVALQNLEELASRMGDKSTAADCRKRYEKMKEILNRYAWDGSWYCYAFDDFGQPVGSRKNKEGKIQLNAQTWAIIAGLPDRVKMKKILKAIDGPLNTPYGPVLFTPAYTKYDDHLGRITAFAPGTKENAAIFCHGAAFKIFADLRINRADKAYQTLKDSLPMSLNKDIEIYKSEPYVFAEYLIGPGNERYGEGAFTWLTGSADWFFVSVTQEMLGIKPDYDGLKIDPCLPASWKKARVVRHFRRAIYEINIDNSKGVSRGVDKIIVDGKRVDSNLIRPHRDGRTHRVQVIMG